jgi:anthranilate phosphoribosyltransferase
MKSQSWDQALEILLAGKDLSGQLSKGVMEEILSGSRSESEIAEFLATHTKKGGTPGEVAGFIDAMYEHAAPISISERAVDTVGTGGDGFHTINISTASAIVAASAGARVIKHGNRAASSKSGAADVLEALGIKIDLNGEQVAKLFNKIGIGFCFAPMFHSAMRYAASARKSLGYPTIFNILGPLSNPAKPNAYAIGVAKAEMFPVVAQVLRARGVDALVFRGGDGLDEISLSQPTEIYLVGSGQMALHTLDPIELSIPRSSVEALRGGDANENAEHLRNILSGRSGAMRDVVLLNAAAAVIAFHGIDSSMDIRQVFAKTLPIVADAIDSGRATSLLAQWRELSHQV